MLGLRLLRRTLLWRATRSTEGLAGQQSAVYSNPEMSLKESAVINRQKLLVSLCCDANDDQNALSGFVSSDIEIDPVCPDVNISLTAEIALPPDIVLLNPGLLQTADGAC